jgi:hypothetical protein
MSENKNEVDNNTFKHQGLLLGRLPINPYTI